MIAFLLDTNHRGTMMNGEGPLAARINAHAASAKFYVSMTSIAELWFMVFNSAKVSKNTERLEELLTDLVRVEFSEEAAKDFGRIKAELRRKGRPVPDADVQIAAVARVQDLIVLTADAHFDYVSGLKTENWLS